MQQLILVNEQDEATGVCEKMKAHENALLHRAYSIFIFNEQNEMLLQQRALTKYHSGGLWTNACCSHPYFGEETIIAAQNRLQDEMGFSTTLIKAFDFIYKANVENGLTEYEFDHVFVGKYNGIIIPNDEEVMNWCYKSIIQIEHEIKTTPHLFTEWFKIALPKLLSWMNESTNNQYS